MIKTTCLGCLRDATECICHSPDKWGTATLDPWQTTTIEGNDAELIEQLKAIRNRIDAVMWLLENPDAFYTIHTLLEDIVESADIILEDYCIEDE